MTTATITQNWSEICRVEDIPQQGARIVRRPGREDIAVFRSHGDEVFALIDRCPIRAVPCRPAWCTAVRSPAPCTTGWSTWTAARRRRPTWAAPGRSLSGSRPAWSAWTWTSHGRGGDSGQHPSGAGRGRGGSQRVLLLRHGLRRARAGQPGRGAGGARRRQPPRQPRPAVQQGPGPGRHGPRRSCARARRVLARGQGRAAQADRAGPGAGHRRRPAGRRHRPARAGFCCSTCPASC